MIRNVQRLLIPQPFRPITFIFRYSNAVPDKKIKYTDTINLPRTKFPSRLTAAKRSQVAQQINEVHIFSPNNP